MNPAPWRNSQLPANAVAFIATLRLPDFAAIFFPLVEANVESDGTATHFAHNQLNAQHSPYTYNRDSVHKATGVSGSKGACFFPFQSASSDHQESQIVFSSDYLRAR